MSADWTVLEIPGVEGVARKAAAKVASDYESVSGLVDKDDLHQEALILLATHGERVRRYVEGPDGLGGLYHDLLMDLINKVTPLAKRAIRTHSYEAVREASE
ncbi:hypothetical protein [Micromonospora sp. CB01531]|uniref:hypothetical protein n=1 Tax=Micromonospora sp. CB01531 TaxID=1718947 RepID=UPI0009393B6F|nr:hypothetical protein [Micromonospora sp. CB01531]OKI45134.1 hypothetical protein A6A27_12025 [Micromonospora sp. CB01531]